MDIASVIRLPTFRRLSVVVARGAVAVVTASSCYIVSFKIYPSEVVVNISGSLRTVGCAVRMVGILCKASVTVV